MLQYIDLDNKEVHALLVVIKARYGYDFTGYAQSSIKRRIHHFMNKINIDNMATLKQLIDTQETVFEQLLTDFSIPVTEMFRDPLVYRTIRNKVISHLKTYPFIKIWHAGCATGEEVYSLAILLKEEGIYDRAQIYATDFNDAAINHAKEGIYDIEKIKAHTANYQKGGGLKSFGDYYHAEGHCVIMNRTLIENVTFANHNLVTDGVFGHMHLILCRNVLIYFDKVLQDHVYKLFTESLEDKGFLIMGAKETMLFSSVSKQFDEFSCHDRIYQKKLPYHKQNTTPQCRDEVALHDI